MGQISIPMSNKVGYSMYWNSMWDNKINYTRSFKEDIYIDKFIYLLFNDSISSNLVFYNDKKLNRSLLNKYNIHFKKNTNYSFKKFILKKNKFNLYTSKIWILKYQNWIVIYFFTYYPLFNNLTKINLINKKNIVNSRSFLYMYANYLKSNEKVNLSFSTFNKNYKYF